MGYNSITKNKIMRNIFKFLNILCISIFVIFPTFSLAYDQNPTLWVQVPQWENDWSECAVDLSLIHI